MPNGHSHVPPGNSHDPGVGRAGGADTVVIVSQGSRNTRTKTTTKVTHGKPAADHTPDYPGKRFGLPTDGPMSVAPMGRRLVALLVDWLLCYLIASSITRHQVFTNADAHSAAAWLAPLLFFVEVYLLTATSGLTVGKRLLGLRVIRTNGGRPGFKWAALRTVLLMCVVPACFADRDLRGMHDRAADTIVVRL
jgi:uncharacterized RDD family membrane protein YckC